LHQQFRKKLIFKNMTGNILLFSLGAPEVILIALVVLLIFGGKKIPELMRGLGKGVNSFKKGLKDVDDEIKNDLKDDTEK
jgi:sec-independent protein translocase protein TatA